MANYYDLGVRKIINGAGTYTKYSGSLMSKEVLEAMAAASHNFVDVEELMRKSGEYLAKLLNVEAALITSGAAAGIVLSTAACMTKGDLKLIRSLPDTEDMRNEVVIMRCHRNPYDDAVKIAGAKIIEIGNVIEKTQPWELDAVIGEKTAAVAFFVQSEVVQASLSLEEVIDIAHKHDIPVIVDAAGELPPVENFQKFIRMGADVVLFSGGKDIRGPQSSGIMLGRSDIINNCRLNSYPNRAIGRSMKLDKETIMGLVTAVEQYLKENQQLRMDRWKEQVEKISQELTSLPGFKVSHGVPTLPFTQPAIIPRVFIEIDKNNPGITKEDFMQRLFQGDPSIRVASDKNYLYINPHMLNEGEEDLIIEEIKKIVRDIS